MKQNKSEGTIAVEKVCAWLKRLDARDFHGVVELTYRKKIVYIRKTQGYQDTDRLR